MKEFFYRVNSGESLVSICRRFNASIETTIKENLLNSEVEEGDLLLIKSYNNVYIAKAGDSYQSIANKFNVLKANLLEKNNLEYVFYGLPIII